MNVSFGQRKYEVHFYFSFLGECIYLIELNFLGEELPAQQRNERAENCHQQQYLEVVLTP